jgi:phosphonate transport system substrate-binding protein
MNKKWIYLLFFVLIITKCTNKSENSGPHYQTTSGQNVKHLYSFAVHPLYNPDKLMQTYQPLIDYLNTNIKNARFNLEASRDYYSFEEKYKSGKPDFLLPKSISKEFL